MKQYVKDLFFTKVPLSGVYRYRDYFQIYPANKEKYPHSHFQKHDPNILEFWITEDEKIPAPEIFSNVADVVSNYSTQIVKCNMILSLLSIFSNHYFFKYKDLEGSWMTPVYKENASDDEINSWTARWCMPLIAFPELYKDFNITSFSAINLPLVNLKSVPDYYYNDPNLDRHRERHLTLPKTIDILFDSYFSKKIDVKAILNAAISHLNAAISLKDIQPTVSLLCAFNAVETMVDFEFQSVEVIRCKECNQLRYSITARFRDYLLKYIGDSKHNRKKFNKYYSLRSKIVHTGKQLLAENLFENFSDPKRDDEFLTRIEILQMSRLAITNWLILNHHAYNV